MVALVGAVLAAAAAVQPQSPLVGLAVSMIHAVPQLAAVVVLVELAS